MLYLCHHCDCVFLQSQTWPFPVDLTETSHLRTVLRRPDMQARVFHQNANNIICNIQGNIIVVLIGEKKKLADESTCPPHFSIILITMAEIKGNMLYNDGCLLSGVTVLLRFVSLRPHAAHLDGRKTLVFESRSRRWMWALRRGTSLCLVLCSMIYSFTPHVWKWSLGVHVCQYVPCYKRLWLHTWGGRLVICVEKGGLDSAEN